MIKNDAWIKEAASNGLIEPFEPSLVRRIQLPTHSHETPVISYGPLLLRLRHPPIV